MSDPKAEVEKDLAELDRIVHQQKYDAVEQLIQPSSSEKDTATKAGLRYAREIHRPPDGSKEGAMRMAAFIAGAIWARANPEAEVPL